MSSSTRAATSRGDKPVLVLTDPKWKFDQMNFDVERFFEEAKVGNVGIDVLSSRFEKFCSPAEEEGGERFLSQKDFSRLNEHYHVCRPEEEDSFFRAMDHRTWRGRIFFKDFLMGCAAASPGTPHILNSFTGLFRARYIFYYYNASKSGYLDYEELAALLADTRQHQDECGSALQSYTTEIAQELGEVSVVTLRVHGHSGPLCDVRVSTRWTGARLRHEIARKLQVPVEGQELLIGQRSLAEGEIIESFLPAGATSATVMLARTNWDRWPCLPEPGLADGVVGVERLIHVTFERFYHALIGEQLRGTSRLFRFHRPILYSKKGALGGA